MTVKFWLYFSPFWLPIGLMATRRVPILWAALSAATVSAALYLGAGEPAVGRLLTEAAKGAWLAVPIVTVVLTGLLFHSLLAAFWTDGKQAVQTRADIEGLRSLVFGTCFLIGPFTEAATGFGVGLVISLGILLRAGIPKQQALVFSLFSQILVGWGAFAVGTMLGAKLVGMQDARELGWRSAVQNVTGSALTMLSPVRVVMGCAVAAIGAGGMAKVYRQAWPLGVIPVALMIAATLLIIR